MPTCGKLHLSEGTWGVHVDSFSHLQPKKNKKCIRNLEWTKLSVMYLQAKFLGYLKTKILCKSQMERKIC